MGRGRLVSAFQKCHGNPNQRDTFLKDSRNVKDISVFSESIRGKSHLYHFVKLFYSKSCADMSPSDIP